MRGIESILNEMCTEAAEAAPIPQTILPWQWPVLAEWSIVGMNHYHLNGERALFVAMTKNGRCIKAEGVDESKVFGDLSRQAAAFEVFAQTSDSD